MNFCWWIDDLLVQYEYGVSKVTNCGPESKAAELSVLLLLLLVFNASDFRLPDLDLDLDLGTGLTQRAFTS